LSASSAADLESGDLLRLTWHSASTELYVGVTAVHVEDVHAGGSHRIHLHVSTASPCWFERGGRRVKANGSVALRDGSVDVELLPLASPPDSGNDRVSIAVAVKPQNAPRPGEV